MNATARSCTYLATLAALCAACASRSAERVLPRLPEPRHGHQVLRTANGYVSIGGFGNARSPAGGKRDVLWLDDGDDAWRSGEAMPTARAFFGALRAGRYVYAIAGGVDRLDLETRRWSKWIRDDVLPTSHFACAVHGNRAWVLGGHPETRSGFWRVDLDKGRVEEATPPPSFRRGDHFHLLHVIDGKLHVVGGLGGPATQPTREHWVLDSRDTWRALPPLPEPVWGKFAMHGVLGNRLIICGLGGAFCYQPDTGWQTLPDAEQRSRVAMPASTATPFGLWVLGGQGIDGRREGAHLLFDHDLRCVELGK